MLKVLLEVVLVIFKYLEARLRFLSNDDECVTLHYTLLDKFNTSVNTSICLGFSFSYYVQTANGCVSHIKESFEKQKSTKWNGEHSENSYTDIYIFLIWHPFRILLYPIKFYHMCRYYSSRHDNYVFFFCLQADT